jgi:AcrR family transcriptional regulator
MSTEARREQLLDAALRVLARDGYAKVSIEAIAREADVTRPVVYSAFDGLGPLLSALLDRTQERGLQRALGIIAAAGVPTDADQWVLRAAEGLFDEVRSEPDIWRPILGLIRGAPAVVSERIAESREVIREQLAVGLDAGLKLRGGPDLDSQVISHLVLATAEEFGRLILEEPPRYDKQRILDTLRHLLAAIQ